ncbi:MAG: T9SS type A sorting domain-containing protein ['Candidatus Kapabacteria' thiocyanatum]|uniref:Secretion system C-terminal sorting domain-containing protein n=1 Tax=Candidatus Kapaibacterium thiocyanatum TaxID=1895771 RepID=A0A1M3KVX0_9BACT|nr:T9SS type A sorting domain-containing protein ['Candidatus Kapabacteria' thiocyanatum]OJX56366.1 MAG: hypothetical protein BGO89_13620 ['Candidatus Kapabacteria' thiocyanatum]
MLRRIRLFMVVLTLLSPSLPLFAQCDSLEQLFVADQSLRVETAAGIQGPGSFVPSFDFEHQTDSTRFFLEMSEFRKNSRWVFLDNWCMEKTWNYSQYLDTDTAEVTNAVLSTLSRTKAIPVSVGDTLSVFRRISWMERSVDRYGFKKLVNPDAISMWVEVVNASTGARIELLDSTHFSSTTASKKPCFQTQHPLFSRLVYIVPAGFPTTDVFIRVNVASAGSVNKRWTRWDNVVQAASNIILNYEGTRAYCDTVEQANDCSPTTASCTFTASTHSSPRRIRATLAASSPITAFDVYSSTGQLIQSASVVSGTTSYDMNVDAGLYYVVARVGSSVHCTRNIVVY